MLACDSTALLTTFADSREGAYMVDRQLRSGGREGAMTLVCCFGSRQTVGRMAAQDGPRGQELRGARTWSWDRYEAQVELSFTSITSVYYFYKKCFSEFAYS
jgi:hypothetical protein